MVSKWQLSWKSGQKKCVLSFVFYGQNFPLVENHCELVTVYSGNVMAVQHVFKWCREFDSGWMNVKDEQRSDLPSMPADPVQDIDAAVQADRCMSIAQLELRFHLSCGIIWDIVHECLVYRQVCCSRFLII